MLYKFTLSVVLAIFSLGLAQPLILKADRILSIDITISENDDFDSAFALAKSIGMQATNLSLTWDEIETSKNTFKPEQNWLKIANDYYPANDTKISLMLGFIDTNNLRLPSDLMNKDFDDPELINRFKAFIDYAFDQIPDLELSALAINNEIDAYLGTDKELWQQYQVFYKEITDYIHAKYPNIEVGTKITFDGLMGFASEQAKQTNDYSDLIMLTYYPIRPNFTVREAKDVAMDINRIVEAYPEKNIYILEAGYPSSSLLDSSEEKQAQFITEMFKAWDANIEHIKLIDFLWLHDVSPESLTYYGSYYGLDSKQFLAFIGSLGLRTFKSKDKLAYKVLVKELKARGWWQ